VIALLENASNLPLAYEFRGCATNAAVTPALAASRLDFLWGSLQLWMESASASLGIFTIPYAPGPPAPFFDTAYRIRGGSLSGSVGAPVRDELESRRNAEKRFLTISGPGSVLGEEGP
jgi:hypothetical protein